MGHATQDAADLGSNLFMYCTHAIFDEVELGFLSSSAGSVSTPDFFVYTMCVRYVCVHVYTHILMYMKRHCVCIQMHCVCRHIHAYMSVFFLLSPHVCACMFTYMHICMQACRVGMCGCACLHVHTLIYMRVCTYVHICMPSLHVYV